MHCNMSRTNEEKKRHSRTCRKQTHSKIVTNVKKKFFEKNNKGGNKRREKKAQPPTHRVCTACTSSSRSFTRFELLAFIALGTKRRQYGSEKGKRELSECVELITRRAHNTHTCTEQCSAVQHTQTEQCSAVQHTHSAMQYNTHIHTAVQ